MKRKIINFVIEFICYEIILVILLLIANKLGWTKSPILETSICLAIGWFIGRVITIIINKNRK